MPIYYAKSPSPSGKQVTVTEHCKAVGDAARTYGAELGMKNAAHLAGLFHDFGKRSPLFQDVLEKKATGVDHAGPGAAFLYGLRIQSNVLEVIAGHHTGLRSIGDIGDYLRKIITHNETETVVSLAGGRPSLLGQQEMLAAGDNMQKEMSSDIPRPEKLKTFDGLWKNKLYRMMATRMLFSCQVDADYSVSAVEESGDTSILRRNTISNPEEYLQRLSAYRKSVIQESNASNNISRLRNTVYGDCEAAGKDLGCDFWTLTAPTGAGKTLGMLKMALERCKADPSKQRIILVLPFLTLTDQAAGIVKEIIPEVLVDTSQVEKSKENQVQSKNWNAPCIITTTVQFFDSLFSDKPGSCRKLHNMANSVIVFDEIQAVRWQISRIVMQSLRWLVSEYHSCIVLSTATQPTFELLPDMDWEAKEVVRNVEECFDLAMRKEFDFIQGVGLASIADEAAKYDNACVVCNLKKHALAVYRQLATRHADGVYLLSTDLCVAHRRAIVQEIKNRQKNGLPVWVAATQCIEAGVDLDFVKVFRAVAPITSVIQAAGRQNRNGKYENLPTTLFEPLALTEGGSLYPGDDYHHQADIVKSMESAGYDLANLKSIREYYRRLFNKFKDPAPLKESLEGCQYDKFAESAKQIEKMGQQVIVPYAGGMELYQEILAAVQNGNVQKRHLAIMGSITVQSYDQEAVMEHCEELVLRRSSEEISTGVYILLNGHEQCYDDNIGLCLGEAEIGIV